MAYYIPVDIECKNIILAIKAVLEEMKNLPISSSYNPDLPLEFRFVRASSRFVSKHVPFMSHQCSVDA
jgi:hypothetical protein